MVTLIKGDCLEKLKGIPDKSVDLIICDLPFGCLAQPQGSGCAWDIKIDLVEFWKEIKRIRKGDHTPTIHFTTTKYGFDLYASNPKEFRYDLVWDKQRGVSFLTANKMPMRSHEMIYVFSKAGANYNRIDLIGENLVGKQKASIYNHKAKTILASSGLRITKENDGSRKCVLSVINNKNENQSKGHPTQKPIDLYKFLIERYSNEGDVVLDPTFGSGNSGLAAKELKRKYIGIEKDDKFFWKATAKFLQE